jgi:hypothetical protein
MRALPLGGGRMGAMTSEYPSTDVSPLRAVRWVLIGASMFWPRLFLLGFLIFDRDIERAFGSWVVPIIGFFVLPWTTVTYAAMWSISSDRVYGIEWLFVGVALLLDLVTWAAVRRR